MVAYQLMRASRHLPPPVTHGMPRTLALALSLVLGLTAAPVTPQPDVVAEIDRIATAAAELAATRVKDADAVTLHLAPFLTDSGDDTPLGNRIRSATHLQLLSTFSATRIDRSASVPVESGFTLSAEIQPFRQVVRVVVMVLRDRSLLDGLRIDLQMSAEVQELLLPDAVDQPGDTRREIDSYEPDDIPGFEVPLDVATDAEVGRSLTPGDRDRFSFYVPASTAIRIWVQADMDTQLFLFQEGDRSPLAVNDDWEEPGGSRLELQLLEGWYVAEVVGYDDAVSGPYTLHLSEVAATEESAPQPQALPAAIRAGERQLRAVGGDTPDRVELRASTPGFYALDARADGVGIMMQVSHPEATRPLLDASLALDAERQVATLFVGAQPLVATVAQLSPDGDLTRYELAFVKISPKRAFADGAAATLRLAGGVASQTLRLFDADEYVAAADGAFGEVSMRVFSLPDMREIEGVPHRQFDDMATRQLSPGDYLVEVVGVEAGDTVRVCWTRSRSAVQCIR